MTDSSQGGQAPPVARRIMYVVKLDTGHKFTYLPGKPVTASEAADAIRQKFPGRRGKFIRAECGDPV